MNRDWESDYEEEWKYYSRKKRLDKGFAWTSEAVQKLRNLNEGLSKIQDTLVEKMREAYEIFSRLEKEGMEFLHGFKVVGWYDFEKSCVTEYYELEEEPTKAQEKEYRRWDGIASHSSEILESWRLVLDSETGDFMPLSKIRIAHTKWLPLFPDFPKQESITACSFLAHLIENDITFSNRDLIACTPEDFSPVLRIVLNRPVSELYDGFANGFRSSSLYRKFPYPIAHMVGDMLEDRHRCVGRKAFEWNEQNIQRILEVNGWLWKRWNEMKRWMKELSAAFKTLAKTNPAFKNYWMEGELVYQGSQATDIATVEMQKAMTCFADFFLCAPLTCESDSRREIDDLQHDDMEAKGINWNFEIFREHLSEEQRKIPFHYLMHTLFVDDLIYTFQDLLRMREEDWKNWLTFSFWEDD